MDWAASTTPASTSARDVSTMRAMNGAAADPDVTAMVLQALASYRGEAAVAAAV